MNTYIDQIGNRIHLKSTPKRIVSLVPSITELLADLGHMNSIVGCTKFCVHPIELRKQAQIVGGTKTINIELINQLNPDLIIANKEENPKKEVLELCQNHKVWVSDVKTVNGNYELIRLLGEILDRSALANDMIKREQEILNHKITTEVRVAYLIWRDPYMTISKDTYIHDMLQRCGYQNVFNDLTRYPTIELQEIVERQPELIFLSSEPYPFKAKHQNELKELLPQSKICLVDGEFFSWYGSRLLHKSSYLSKLHNLVSHQN